MLPGIDGIEVCRRIRAQSGVPIIMLTARSEIEDTVRGLGAGADDYIVKPFNKAELIARIRARLRDQHGAVRRRLRVDDVDIDVAGRVVERYGQKISLTPLEFDLLVTMAARPGEVVTRTELLRQVWGYRGTTDEPRLINVHIQRLRAKVEKDPDKPVVVQTVRGIGYKAGMPR
jgi:two-component system response regulator MtrA